jgi:hypothetical protein
MLHTDSHGSDSGALWREGRTILGTKSKLLYSEIALPRKFLGIEYMYVYTFLLRITDTMTSQNIDLSSWDSMCKCCPNVRLNLNPNVEFVSKSAGDIHFFLVDYFTMLSVVRTI